MGSMPLRQQMTAVKPRVEKLRALKFTRVKEFAEVLGAIGRLQEELSGADDERAPPGAPQDLTLKRLEELREKLKELQAEKVGYLWCADSWLVGPRFWANSPVVIANVGDEVRVLEKW